MLVTASLASATPSEADAKAIVQKALIKPLTAKEERHSRFSRAYMPPQARRVRVLDEKALTDSKGAEFMSFAVDSKSGFAGLDDLDDDADADKAARAEKAWRKDVITGCVYPDSGEVFVKRGGKFFGGGLLLGKKSSAAAEHVCVSAAGEQVAAK